MKRFWRASGRLYLAFLVLALVSFIGSLLIGAFQGTFSPFPTFGGTFARAERWIGVAALILWASAVVNVYRAVVSSPAATEESTGAKALMLFSFVAGLLALCGWLASTTALPVCNRLHSISVHSPPLRYWCTVPASVPSPRSSMGPATTDSRS